AYLARPDENADRRAGGGSLARHGGDGRDQDRRAADRRGSAVAAAALQAGEVAGAGGSWSVGSRQARQMQQQLPRTMWTRRPRRSGNPRSKSRPDWWPG